MPLESPQASSAFYPTPERREMQHSISPPPQSKVPAKISCLACRAAKRKCLTPDALTVCKRCADQGLECEYKKHRRGRRKKVLDDGGEGHQDFSPRRSVSRSRSPPRREREERYTGPETAADRERERERIRDTRDSQGQTASRPRHAIMFSHVVPIEGDSTPYIPRPGAPGAPEPGSSVPHLRSDCPDPVSSGILSEGDAYELFEFYFHHLNMTVAFLDPVLHTATFCRDKSPLLFTAVLTVTAKIIRPEAYGACLLISNKLFGQACEFGLCSIEVIQAVLVLTHWKKADDRTAWRKTGYAIRMAQELRLNQRAPRPLPRNERQAREVLNRERCWLNLVVADYHLAMHHSFPKMISDDSSDDPSEWINEHPHLPCPGEAVLAPWITFSRMCRLFSDMLQSMNGHPANMRSLHWLEMERTRWCKRWIVRNSDHNFLQQQLSTLKMCDALLYFHILEYRLLFCARYRSNGRPLDTSQPSDMSRAFAACMDQALHLLEVFEDDFVAHGYLPYCFNLTWVGVAIVSVWLVKNIAAMDQVDRATTIAQLNKVAESTAEGTRTTDDMASYTHRLLKHLLGGVAPEYTANSRGTRGAVSLDSAQSLQLDTPPAPAAQPSPVQLAPWAMPSAQQIIQEQLWHPGLFDWPTQTPGQQQSRQPQAMPGQPPATILPDGVPGQIPTDVLFAAADDDIWKLLFPL